MIPPAIKGGQGRDDDDLRRDMSGFLLTVLLCAGILLAAWGCS